MSATRFTDIEAGSVKVSEIEAESLKTPAKTTSISKAADYELSATEKTEYIGITLTATSKTVTLGLPSGKTAVVKNEGGTNAFTVKNVSGDSGASLAAGKAIIIFASETANGSVTVALG